MSPVFVIIMGKKEFYGGYNFYDEMHGTLFKNLMIYFPSIYMGPQFISSFSL